MPRQSRGHTQKGELMTQTVIGTFDNTTDADDAIRDLVDAGISRTAIQLHSQETGTTPPEEGTTHVSGDHDHAQHGFFARIEHFFSNLVGDNDRPAEFSHYHEAIRRGGALVSVEVSDDDDFDRVKRVLDDAGAVDIDERAAQWQSTGYTPYSVGGATSSADGYTGGHLSGSAQGASQDMAPGGTMAAGQTLSSADASLGVHGRDTTAGLGSTTSGIGSTAVTGEQAIPVVEEELAVGKRKVQTGAYRVYSRQTETPVTENVTLREEHASIERRPVDRPATEADRTSAYVEVKETDETAVVQKTARVVEEVVVGKESSQRTETIHDTLRGTQVEVERVEGDGRNDGTLKTPRP
jgi:uncharacterized protein (TIGR02271 family)